MKLISKLFYAFGILGLISCNPKVITNISETKESLKPTEEILVLSLNQGYPDDYEEIGMIEIKDAGLSNNCKYDRVVALAKKRARESGGNVIKIFSHEEPNEGSFCDQIKAMILKVDNIDEIHLVDNFGVGEKDISDDYATLYIYRKNSSSGMEVSYPLYYGDSMLCLVKNNFKTKVRLYNVESNLIWAKVDSKKEIPVFFERSNEYYIRCSVDPGLFVNRPEIEMIDKYKGRKEYSLFRTKEGFKDVIYLKDGNYIIGDIVEETEQGVYIETKINRKNTFKRIDRLNIKQIVYGE